MRECEFCCEVNGHPGSRFRRIYRGIAETRLVAETRNFVAMPTLGQVFTGSMLIMPRAHVETCARLDAGLRGELAEFVNTVSRTARQFGEPVWFEHGATACTGGSCGIYHAHLHVVPLPVRVAPNLLFEAHRASGPDLLWVLDALKECDHYLLLGSEDGIVFAQVEQLESVPSSQYFRRLLCEKFGRNRPWDWREATLPEADLLYTISAFERTNSVQWTGHPA